MEDREDDIDFDEEPIEEVATAKKFNKRNFKTKKKLENFFGANIPVDVSIRDIENLGLRALLASRVPICYFLYQLLEEHCSENLFFFLEVDLYEHTKFQARQMQIDIGVELYDTFLRADSEFEVNIPQKIKAPVLEMINSGNHGAFSEAKEHIQKLMEPVFTKFKNGPIFTRMKQELGYTSVYNKQARNYAVRILLQNLDKTLPKANGAGAGLSLAQERNDMIRAMLHAFCEMKLGIDFIDRDLKEQDESTMMDSETAPAKSSSEGKKKKSAKKKNNSGSELNSFSNLSSQKADEPQTVPSTFDAGDDTFAAYLDNMWTASFCIVSLQVFFLIFNVS